MGGTALETIERHHFSLENISKTRFFLKKHLKNNMFHKKTREKPYFSLKRAQSKICLINLKKNRQSFFNVFGFSIILIIISKFYSRPYFMFFKTSNATQRLSFRSFQTIFVIIFIFYISLFCILL